MPTLRVRLVDVLEEFAPYGKIRATLGDETLVRQGDGTIEFDFAYELRNGKPSGPLVERQPDRRFFYIGWWGSENSLPVRFRRLKVDIDPTLAGIVVQGRDAKGGPACATATILERFAA